MIKGAGTYCLVSVVGFILFIQGLQATAQDLYFEDFELPSGTTEDNGITAWSTDVSNANLGANGFFETRSTFGLTFFQGSDIDGEAIWRSQVVDISGESAVQVSVEVAEFGNMEASDYLRLYYVLDGGSETIFGDLNDDFGLAFQSIASPLIAGTNLQIVIRVSNNSFFESHLFDNVRIYNQTGGPTLYSRNSGNWDGLLTWSNESLAGFPCLCTPDENTNAIIGSSHNVTLNESGSVRNLTIQDNASLNSTGSFDLSINGNFSISSTNADPLTLGNQTLILNGSGDQELALNNEDLYNLMIDKPGGMVLLAQSMGLLGALNFLTATELASNGNLTLISTSDGTDNNATIGTIPNGGSVTGDVTVQRFVSGEGEIWRYLSSPITNASIADWQDDFPITGNFDDPSNGPGINSSKPSLYLYGESGSGTDKQLGWLAYPTSGSASDNLIEPGAGYSALIIGGETPTVIEVTGPINQGGFGFNVSNAGSGWNLLGNPYPATIDWGNPTGWSNSNLANAIYIRNNENGNSNSVIASYVDGVGTNGGTGLIATGQSFWVQAIGANPSLSINERAKSGSTGVFFRNQAPGNLFRIRLTSQSQSDEAVIRFRGDATSGYDPQFDAKKFKNGTINLASFIEDPEQSMAINTLPELTESVSVQLALSNVKPSNYSLLFSELNKLNLPYSIHLIDHHIDSVLLVTDSTGYDFSTDSLPGSYQQRFELRIDLKQAPSTETIPSLSELAMYPNPVSGYLNIVDPGPGNSTSLVVYNNSGKKVMHAHLVKSGGTAQVDFSILPPGVYFVGLTGSAGKTLTKIIKSP